MHYAKYQRRHLIKTGILCAFILGFALVSTYFIYHKFYGKNDQVYQEENLRITFHEKEGNKVTIQKITPVTDSVGLSTSPYSLTLENHTDHSVRYIISLENDEKTISDCGCIDNGIPYSIIKLGVHSSKKTLEPKLLSDIPNLAVYQSTLKKGEKEDVELRLWIDRTSTDINRDGHYHAQMIVKEQIVNS